MQPRDHLPDRATDDARRGAMHVRVGIALNVVGLVAFLVLAMTELGPDVELGARDWLGAVVSEVVWIAAVLSSNRIVQWFVAITGIFCLLAAITMAVIDMLVPDLSTSTGMPALPFAATMTLIAAGSLLATATPAASAWHRAQRAARAARKRVRSLADWRAVG